jgi:hypothetical protein
MVGRSGAGLSLLLQGGVDRVQQVGFLKRFDQVASAPALSAWARAFSLLKAVMKIVGI